MTDELARVLDELIGWCDKQRKEAQRRQRRAAGVGAYGESAKQAARKFAYTTIRQRIREVRESVNESERS